MRTNVSKGVSRFFCESAKLLGLLVDLIGIEPMTSSMPCCGSKTKLLMKQYLSVGKTGKTGLVGSICCQNAAKNQSSGDRAGRGRQPDRIEFFHST
jgi:hypothetical protein